MEEVWKDIKEYEGLYQVSNLGRVRRILFRNNRIVKPKITLLKIQKHTQGYCKVTLCKNGKEKDRLIHQLVAECFIENEQNKPFINHIDGNKQNNKSENLEWCNQKENMKHAVKHNLIKYN